MSSFHHGHLACVKNGPLHRRLESIDIDDVQRINRIVLARPEVLTRIWYSQIAKFFWTDAFYPVPFCILARRTMPEFWLVSKNSAGHLSELVCFCTKFAGHMKLPTKILQCNSLRMGPHQNILQCSGARRKSPLAFTKVVSLFQVLTIGLKTGCMDQVSI